mgnify:CR=1 FL=1
MTLKINLHILFSLICRGLIVSKMFDTAKGMVENLLHLVKVYGFVLNGARAYYENRRSCFVLVCQFLLVDILMQCINF